MPWKTGQGYLVGGDELKKLQPVSPSPTGSPQWSFLLHRAASVTSAVTCSPLSLITTIRVVPVWGVGTILLLGKALLWERGSGSG